jgi:hypothetical protein
MMRRLMVDESSSAPDHVIDGYSAFAGMLGH